MASRGLQPDEAKARSPSCGKCATATMRELGLPSPLPSPRRPRKPPEKTEAFWRMVDGGMAPEVPELRDVLDRLGKVDATGKPCPPVVVTLAQVVEALCLHGWSRTGGDLYNWLSDRKNRRTIPHRFESCGYVPVRNSSAESGLWVIAGKR